MSVRVILKEVDPFAGGLVFQLTHLDDEPISILGRNGRSNISRKKQKKPKHKYLKNKRKERVKTRP